MPRPAPPYLAFGDSYTVGEGVEPSEAWPRVLARLLGDRGHRLEEPTIVARTGWTTDELLEAALGTISPPNPALVTLMVGVNDQYRGRPVGELRAGFHRLLGMVAERAPASRLLVLSIPDWGATPFASGWDRNAIAAAVDTFNAEERALVHAAGARWLDVTPLSRKAAADPALVAGDGLHFSSHAHRLVAEAALAPVLQILGNIEARAEGFPLSGGSA
ncbi:MAG: SGNH/GDSL hydrolase family protein [Thermoanaerobaculia bacterium]